ncbi:MAG: hypothetical protein R2705_04610 [Ilumatobacteraceae bacterium]
MCDSLAETDAQSLADPTCTGDSWVVVLPIPSWPSPLRPQHHNVPVVLMAQV